MNWVRGDAFFVRRLDRPAGTPEAEIPDFVALQLEELSPFPIEQLYLGHVRSGDGSAVFVYAAYRRRFSAEQTAAWSGAQYVMPDFAPALRLRFTTSSVVLLRSETTLTALYFEGGRELPLRVASRALAPEATPDEIERVQQTVLALVEPGSAHEVALAAKALPESRAKGVQISYEPMGHGSGVEVFIPGAECWAMDVRDPEFVAQQRKRLGLDLVLWRIVLGAAAAIALLFLGEVLLFAGKGYASWLRHRSEQRAPEIASIRDKDAAATRLEDFGRSGVQPFDMLSAVTVLRPRASPSEKPPVYFTRTTAKGVTVLEIEGQAPDVASINAYEAALRAAPNVKGVEVRRVTTRNDGSSFSFAVTFKSGAFSRGAAAVDTVAQGNP